MTRSLPTEELARARSRAAATADLAQRRAYQRFVEGVAAEFLRLACADTSQILARATHRLERVSGRRS